MSQRLSWLTSSDDQLLAECEVDTYRASGPGGQKRNKTSSAVRLRHRPSGLLVIAEESRSQHDNKAKALRRLRQAIALKIRESFDAATVARHPAIAAIRPADGKLHVVSERDPRFWPAIAIVLDVVYEHQAQIRDAATVLETTTANLLALLELDDKAWEQVNILRHKFGHKPLRLNH